MPEVDNPIPEAVTLVQNWTKPDCPAKHVMAALKLGIDCGRRVSAQINL
jgi:hypothetical protein